MKKEYCLFNPRDVSWTGHRFKDCIVMRVAGPPELPRITGAGGVVQNPGVPRIFADDMDVTEEVMARWGLAPKMDQVIRQWVL